MQTRLIEKIAIVLFALFLLGPAALVVSRGCDIHLPSWATAEDAAVLEGSWSNADVSSHVDLEGVLTQELQRSVEDRMGDFVPFKAATELGYAGLQRASIGLAGMPLGYSVYPTFYGASYLVDSRLEILYSMPWHGEEHVVEIESALDGILQLAEGHEDLNWVFCLTADTGISELNVANALVSRRIKYAELLDLARGRLSNMKVVDSSVSSEETRFEDLFRTDHHLQIQGAFKVYERIIDALGREPVVPKEFYLASTGPYYGSRARLGLCLDYSDDIFDVAYDCSDLAVSIDGERAEMADIDKAHLDASDEPWSKFEDPYGYWFHPDYALVEFENPDLPASSGALLLISDSSDNSTDRLYAESYRHVYELDMRLNSIDDMNRFMESHEDICDVVVFGSPNILVRSFGDESEG